MKYDKELCGLAIASLREREGMPVKELASFLMMDERDLREIEAGAKAPGETELLMLSNYFHVYPESLAVGVERYRKTDAELIDSANALMEKLAELQKLIMDIQELVVETKSEAKEAMAEQQTAKQTVVSVGI